MKLGELIRTAAGNLGRRKVRTALTTSGIVVGVMTIVAMLSLGVGVQREIRKQFEALGLENLFIEPNESEGSWFTRPERSNPLTREVIARWRELPGVVSVEPGISIGSSVASFLQFDGERRQVRIDTDPVALAPGPFQEPPTALAGLLEPQRDDQIVIYQGALPASLRNAEAAQSLLGKQVEIVLQTPRGEQQSFTFTIAGVVTRSRAGVRLPVEARAQIKSWWYNSPDIIAEDGYDYAVVRGADINAARSLAKTIREAGFQVRSVETILELAGKVFAVINVMLGSVGGLALFVASLGIINTMIMAIYERTREIGTLKAIGASRGDIRALFMLEAGLIGLIGGVIGTLLGWLIGLGLNRAALWYLEQEEVPIRGTFFVIPLWLVALALAFATLIGILAGLYPAGRAARLDPIQALRHE